MKNKLLEKTFQILKAIGESEKALTLKELSERFDISAATASRIVSDLQEARLVEKRDYHSVGVSLGLIRIGQRALGNLPLMRIVNPILRRKADELGVQAALAGMSEDEVVYLFRTQLSYPSLQTGIPYHSKLSNSNIAVMILTKTLGTAGAEAFYERYGKLHPEDELDMDELRRCIQQANTVNYCIREEEGNKYNVCFPLTYAKRVYGVSFFNVMKDRSYNKILFEMSIMMNSIKEEIVTVTRKPDIIF